MNCLQAKIQIADGGDNIKSLNLGLIMGDQSGYIYTQDTQKFFVEYDEFALLRSSPPVNFIVDHGSQMYVSTDLRLIGSETPALQLDGHLAGVLNLTLEEGRKMYMGETATNSRLIDKVHVTLENGRWSCIFIPPEWNSGHLVFVLSVCLSVCDKRKFKPLAIIFEL